MKRQIMLWIAKLLRRFTEIGYAHDLTLFVELSRWIDDEVVCMASGNISPQWWYDANPNIKPTQRKPHDI